MTIDFSPVSSRKDELGALYAAVAEGCAARGAPTTLRELLFCIRDMPYLRPGDSASVSSVLSEWRATCSGKHVVVHALLLAAGLRPRLMMRAYSLDAADGLPRALVEPYHGRGIFDVHNFIRCDLGRGEISIDVTWPARLRDAGFAIAADWDGSSDFAIAAPSGEDVEISCDGEGIEQKRALLKRINSPGAKAAREQFIEALARHAADLCPWTPMRETIRTTLDRTLRPTRRGAE